MKKFFLQVIGGLTGSFIVFLILSVFQMQFDASQWNGITQGIGVGIGLLMFVFGFAYIEEKI